MRVGIAGAGRHSASSHGASLQLLAKEAESRITLSAVCDLELPKAKEYAKRFGFAKAYDDLDKMLSTEKLDALLVITDATKTEALIAKVLQLDIPVLIEKPPAKDSDTAQELMNIASRKGSRHMVSFNRRFSPALQRAVRWINEKPEQRKPRLVLGRMIRNKRLEDNFPFGTGIHTIDAVLSILGTPSKIEAANHADATGTPRFFFGRVVTAADAEGIIVLAPAAGAVKETYEIHGDNYLAVIDFFQCSAHITKDGNEAVNWKAPEGSSPQFINGSLDEMRSFLSQAESATPMHPDLSDALQAMRIAEAMQNAEAHS